MIIEGIALGGITLAAFGISYNKLPRKCKVLMVKHPVLTDVVCAVFFYKVMGVTLVAHVAMAVMTLGVQGFLHVQKNPEDYKFLFDLSSTAKIGLDNSLAKLRLFCKELNDKAQARKEIEVVSVEA